MSRVHNIKNREPIQDPRALRLIAECTATIRQLGLELPANTKYFTCKARRRAGLACYTDNTIVLSNFLFNEEDRHAKATIFHEMAHLIAGPGVHHGPRWQQIIRRITNLTGIHISRCYSETDMPVHSANVKNMYKYIFQCKGCGCKIHRMKASRFTRTYNEILPSGKPRWTCSSCGSTFELISEKK